LYLFYIATKFDYQVFITRTYVEKLNSFYTTSFSILKNKEQINYEILIEELKKIPLNITIIVKLVQNIFIAILEEQYLMQQKKYFLI